MFENIVEHREEGSGVAQNEPTGRVKEIGDRGTRAYLVSRFSDDSPVRRRGISKVGCHLMLSQPELLRVSPSR